MRGPGKYDAETTVARESAKATGVVLIVMGGDRGHGFSVQAPDELMAVLPDVLVQVAQDIRAEWQRTQAVDNGIDESV